MAGSWWSLRDKKWIVFLAWEPHLMNTKFHLTYLDGGDKYFGPNFAARRSIRSRGPVTWVNARTWDGFSSR